MIFQNLTTLEINSFRKKINSLHTRLREEKEETKKNLKKCGWVEIIVITMEGSKTYFLSPKLNLNKLSNLYRLEDKYIALPEDKSIYNWIETLETEKYIEL